jgi:diguanylate cyclase (GGDEF)-like protein/PAS domain S-box-containing protein
MEDKQVIQVLCVQDTGDQPNLKEAMCFDAPGFELNTRWVATYETGIQALVEGRYDLAIIGSHIEAYTGENVLQAARVRVALPPTLLLLTERATANLTHSADDYLIESQLSPLLLQTTICRLLERIQLREALRVLQERYLLLARGSNDGVWDLDIYTGELFLSQRWRELLGDTGPEISTTIDTWLDLAYPEDRDTLKQAFAAAIDGSTPDLQVEVRMQHVNASLRWMLIRGSILLDDDGRPRRLAGSLTDITIRKSTEARIERSALYDTLTGLPNQTLLLDRLHRAIEYTRRHPEYRFALLCLDFDRFNVVNDSLGRLIGDQLLVAIAQRLESCLRSGDTVARLSGDEFALLVEYISDLGNAAQIAERVQRTVAKPFTLGEHELFTSVSIGIALSITGYEQPETVLRDAGMAMSRAKSRGRGGYELFDSNMHARIMRQLQLEIDLRRALDRDEFEVYYQPIVALANGATIGFEALVRWQHPQQGLIGPGEFLQAAEDSGLIAQLDRWVLRQACKQMAAWHNSFSTEAPLYVSVNLSGRDFSRPDLAEQIAHELHLAGLDGQSLRLEITEGVLIEHSEIAAATLSQLRQLGVQISIDDFGTGYSSLSYLHRFPVDTLKIDRSFVMLLGDVNQNTKIIQAIITLARDLGLSVVAEGIETREQFNYLHALHCDYGQGYFFSRPLDRIAAANLLTKQYAAQ